MTKEYIDDLGRMATFIITSIGHLCCKLVTIPFSSPPPNTSENFPRMSALKSRLSINKSQTFFEIQSFYSHQAMSYDKNSFCIRVWYAVRQISRLCYFFLSIDRFILCTDYLGLYSQGNVLFCSVPLAFEIN